MKAAAAQPRPRTERAFLALVLRMNRDLANSETLAVKLASALTMLRTEGASEDLSKSCVSRTCANTAP